MNKIIYSGSRSTHPRLRKDMDKLVAQYTMDCPKLLVSVPIHNDVLIEPYTKDDSIKFISGLVHDRPNVSTDWDEANRARLWNMHHYNIQFYFEGTSYILDFRSRHEIDNDRWVDGITFFARRQCNHNESCPDMPGLVYANLSHLELETGHTRLAIDVPFMKRGRR